MNTFNSRFFRFTLIPLALVFVHLSLSESASAHSSDSADRRAQREFFHLKRTGEWRNYTESKSYLEIVGTSFIGLEMASNEKRTCLFGFFQPREGKTTVLETHTSFVCYSSGAYEWVQRMEWCVGGMPGCEIDPAGISIGIGNIEILNPAFIDEPGVEPLPLLPRYPSTIHLSFHKPEMALPQEFPQGPDGPTLPPWDTHGQLFVWPSDETSGPETL